jgi:hypothetical protein
MASSHADEAVRRAAKAVAAIPTDSEPLASDPPMTACSATLDITSHCARALLKDHALIHEEHALNVNLPLMRVFLCAVQTCQGTMCPCLQCQTGRRVSQQHT